MVLLVFPPPEHFWIGRMGKICQSQRCCWITNVRAKISAEMAPAAQTVSQLNRKQFPVEILADQNGSYHDISNT
jgi:hypothetical protein